MSTINRETWTYPSDIFAGDIDNHDPFGDAHLWRSKSYATVGVHGFEHVLRQFPYG